MRAGLVPIGWARCHLLSPQGNVFLGANDTKYVLDGLEFAVDEPHELYQDSTRMNDILGYRARYVLALIEAIPKHILCVAEENAHRLLLCLEDGVNGGSRRLAHGLRLLPSDRQRWREQLRAMRAESQAAGEQV